MVVVLEARIGKALGLFKAQHAEGGAALESLFLDCPYQLSYVLHLAVGGAAPGCSHSEAGSTGFARAPCGLAHLIHSKQVVRPDVGVVVNALRAVLAVLGTTTGLDAQQGADLHFVWVEVRAVHGLRLIQQIVERLLVDPERFVQ